MSNIKLYGAIGYTILYNSNIFPDTEILLIADMHDEYNKDCGNSNLLTIDVLLGQYLNNKYSIILEEIPLNKQMIELFPNSSHVKNVRKFYLENMDKVIAVDLRLELLDLTSLENSSIPIMIHLINLYEFFTIKSKLFDMPIVKSIYTKLLKVFLHINKKYKKEFKKSSKDINKLTLKNIISDFDDLLSSILDFYCFVRIYDILSTKKQSKIVVYCGLAHIDEINKILTKKLNYNVKFKKGKTNIDDVSLFTMDNICIDLIKF